MHGCASARVYTPRRTPQCDAAAILREHLPAFLERAEVHGGPLPTFVERELSAFSICGDLRQGFLRVACRHCGDELRVPFACKGRGVCPSCMGRRMAEGAALLVDTVLPPVRYRQWVLSFAGPMSVRLGYDAPRLARVSRCFARRVMQSVRARVKRHHELPTARDLHAGVVTVVQRFRSDLALYVHLHSLATDGAFLDVGGGSVRWLAAPPLSDADLQRVLAGLHRDLATGDDTADEGEEGDIDPALAGCLSLSLGGPPPLATATRPPVPDPLTATAFGMSLHAATAVDGRDRPRLERMCRYLLRPPFAHDAVERLAGDRVRVHFKRTSRAGATHADMSTDRFLARLCALVPPPRVNTIRYYGVFANRHHLRSRVVPARDPAVAGVPRPARQLDLFGARPLANTDAAAASTSAHGTADRSPRRISWAQLLARVFAVDVTVCARCGGPMRILEAVTDPAAIARHLAGARGPHPRRPRPVQGSTR